MSINDMQGILSYTNHEDRLEAMSEYIHKVDLDGLHYNEFFSEQGIGCIVKPNYSTHEEATYFLLNMQEEGTSPNTIKAASNELPKFLDYLMIFNISLEDLEDIKEVLLGFVYYLRLLGTKDIRVQKSIVWSLLDYIPLIDDTLNDIEINQYGSRTLFTSKAYQPKNIARFLQRALQYLDYYNKNINTLPLNSLPRTEITQDSLNSSTRKNKRKRMVYDLQFFLTKAGLANTKSNKRTAPTEERIPTEIEMDTLMKHLSSNTSPINHLLILTLKGFGIRASELTNIYFDVTKLPANFLRMNYHEALDVLKSTQYGDIYYHESIRKWVCNIQFVDTADLFRRNKSGSRQIPYMFEQELFTDALYKALRERNLFVEHLKTKNPPELFISVRNHGKPMKNYTVYSKVKTISKKISKITNTDLDWIHPHTFRHFFATFLLRRKKFTLDDVSRYLGHADSDITRITYIHYLDDENTEDKSIIKNIGDTLSN